MMLELNNYYIQELENLTDLFTNIFVIIDDIYNEIIPIGIRNRRNIKDSKLSDSEIITISIVGELLTIDSEKSFFSLLKREYKDNQTYLNEKQNLFQNLTYHMIEKELHHNDIDINYEEVLNYYNDCKDTDETIAYFDEKYDQQLDRLGEKNEMFDDDALVYYIVKVIEHHEDIHQVPDKNYIASDIIDLIQKDHDYYDLLEQTQSIMKRLIKMKHEKNQDLQNTFSPYGIDLEQFFTRVFQEIDYVEHQGSFLTKIYSLLKELQNEYALSLRYVEIQMDVLSTLTKYTQENLDEEIKELCKNYPQYRFMLYYKIMTTLQQIGNNDLLKKYYQEINTCIPMNEEQKDLLEVIQEIFG